MAARVEFIQGSPLALTSILGFLWYFQLGSPRFVHYRRTQLGKGREASSGAFYLHLPYRYSKEKKNKRPESLSIDKVQGFYLYPMAVQVIHQLSV